MNSVIRFVPVPSSLNVGCTQCGDSAVQVLVQDESGCLEIIESQCVRHSEVF